MFPAFEVIPAVDIQDGQAVQLVGGERDTETAYGDPERAARRWIDAGAETIHCVDLDGAFDGERQNEAAIQAIVDTQATVQVGGGIRSPEAAISLLESGVDRVILGTLAIEEPAVVETISDQYPDGVLVSVDARDGAVVVEGWTERTEIDPATAAKRYESLGAAGILFTDVDVEGQLDGVRADPVERVAGAVDIPVIASGGVSTLDDIRTLSKTTAGAVVVGTALYEQAFTLQSAIEAANNQE